MAELRKYGVATTIYFPLVDRGTADFESTPVSFVAADTQFSEDGAAFGNTGSTPSHEGNGIYSLALLGTELEGATIVITVIDAATKAWEDQAILIDTYGDPSAQHEFDLDSDRMARAVDAIVIGTASGTPTTTVIATSSLDPAAAVTDQFAGAVLSFDRLTTTANLRGQRTIIASMTSGGVITVSPALTTAPVSGDTFTIQ